MYSSTFPSMAQYSAKQPHQADFPVNAHNPEPSFKSTSISPTESSISGPTEWRQNQKDVSRPKPNNIELVDLAISHGSAFIPVQHGIQWPDTNMTSPVPTQADLEITKDSACLHQGSSSHTQNNIKAIQTELADHPRRPVVPRVRLTTTMWEDEDTICYQVDLKNVCVSRRKDNNMINGTKLLNVTGMSRGKRDGILKNEKDRVVIKVGAMHLKGVWITFSRAYLLATRYKIHDSLYPLFVEDPSVFLYVSPFQHSVGKVDHQNQSYRRLSLLGSTSSIIKVSGMCHSDTHGTETAEQSDSGFQHDRYYNSSNSSLDHPPRHTPQLYESVGGNSDCHSPENSSIQHGFFRNSMHNTQNPITVLSQQGQYKDMYSKGYFINSSLQEYDQKYSVHEKSDEGLYSYSMNTPCKDSHSNLEASHIPLARYQTNNVSSISQSSELSVAQGTSPYIAPIFSPLHVEAEPRYETSGSHGNYREIFPVDTYTRGIHSRFHPYTSPGKHSSNVRPLNMASSDPDSGYLGSKSKSKKPYTKNNI